jgi:cell division protein FtsQ
MRGVKKSAQGLTLGQLRRRRWLQSRGRTAVVAVAAVVVVALTIWLLYFSSLLAVHHVSVSGEQMMTASEIETAAKAPFGTPLIDANLDQIRQRIQAMPGIQSATVSRSWPQTISITVIERVPVAVVSTPGGLRDIDASGVLFGRLDHRPAGLPLIQLSGSVDNSALRGAATVAASLPSSILKQVTSITVRTMDDIRLNLTQGRRVRWGNATDSVTKAEVATELLNLRKRIIDVSVPSNPTTG